VQVLQAISLFFLQSGLPVVLFSSRYDHGPMTHATTTNASVSTKDVKN